MKHHRASLSALIVAGVMCGAVATPAAARTVGCQSVKRPTVYRITETNSRCSTARTVARRMARAFVGRCLSDSTNYTGRCHVEGGGRTWLCHLGKPAYVDSNGDGHTPYVCTSGPGVTRFHLMELGYEAPG